MKIVFFGTSNVALPSLEALYKYHQVLAVVTQPDAAAGRDKILTMSPVAAWAWQQGLPVLKPAKVKGAREFLEELKKLNADIFIVVSYGQILPPEVINLPRLKTLNIHFSLLPKYRGASPIQFALLNGDKQTGTTIFILDETMDTGPIVAQDKYPVSDDDDFASLSGKLAAASADLLVKILPDYESGKITPLPQGGSQASYTKIISKDDGRIDWHKTAPEIYNLHRAFKTWPGIWTMWQGKKLKITDCQIVDGSSDQQAGTVLANGIVVCGHKTFLKINRLQLEGKKETDIASFLNGYKLVGAHI